LIPGQADNRFARLESPWCESRENVKGKVQASMIATPRTSILVARKQAAADFSFALARPCAVIAPRNPIGRRGGDRERSVS